jgi:hypothetical protein
MALNGTKIKKIGFFPQEFLSPRKHPHAGRALTPIAPRQRLPP